MSITYSKLCETSEVAYLAYLAAILVSGKHGVNDEQPSDQHGVESKGCCGGRDNDGVGAFLDAAVSCIAGRTDSVRRLDVGDTATDLKNIVNSRFDGSHAAGVSVSGVSGGDLGCNIRCRSGGESDELQFGVVEGQCVDAEAHGRPVGRQEESKVVVDSVVRGKRYAENKKRRERKKAKRGVSVGVGDLGAVPEWRRKSVPVGFCETVVSQQSCPSYGQALSDAEREAKESLARRRAAENAVAEKLAKMKLESLEDEQKCQEYAELKRQRVIQWTNEATAKSQQSLEKCKSIDPSSSASQYEIRKQAKALADLREEHAVLLKVFSERVPDHRKILDMLRPVSSESMERYALEGMDAAVSVPDYADSMYDVHLTH